MENCNSLLHTLLRQPPFRLKEKLNPQSYLKLLQRQGYITEYLSNDIISTVAMQKNKYPRLMKTAVTLGKWDPDQLTAVVGLGKDNAFLLLEITACLHKYKV